MNVRTVYTRADIDCAVTLMSLLSTRRLLFKVRLNRVYVVRPTRATDMRAHCSRPLMSRDMYVVVEQKTCGYSCVKESACMYNIQILNEVVWQPNYNVFYAVILRE